MANEIRHILDPYFQKLPELRGSPSLWQEFKFASAPDEAGHISDANHQQRTNLLVALFYDQRSSDENLLRFLLKQEIEMLRNVPVQGDPLSLKICIGLLSRFRNVSNIELLIEAKEANSETGHAFDLVAFVAPGIAKSYDHVPNFSEQHKNTFIESLGPSPDQCTVSEEEATEWLDNRAGMLPVPLEKLSLENEIFLSDLIGDVAVRNNKIIAWIASVKKWDRDTHTMLYDYESMRGNIQGQITALKKLGEYEEDGSLNKQMNFYQLSGLYLASRNIDEAYKNICSSVNNYTGPMQWVACRMYVDRFLDIVLASRDRNDPKCIASFKWIKEYLDHEPWMKNWDVKILPRIMTASTVVGDNETMKKFADLFRIRKLEHDDTIRS